MPETIYILWWHYGDGSGFGVLRAYTDPERAAEDMRLLDATESSKQWKLEAVAVLGQQKS